jgi:hypothetical protein
VSGTTREVCNDTSGCPRTHTGDVPLPQPPMRKRGVSGEEKAGGLVSAAAAVGRWRGPAGKSCRFRAS